MENLDNKTKDQHQKHLVDGKYSFKDLVDIDQLRAVFERFSKATGFTTGLISYPNQELLIRTGWRDICTKYHRSLSNSEIHCKQSNLELTSLLNEQKSLNIKHCENGLIDGATPIIIKGTHVANLVTGQILFEKPDIKQFRKQAETYGYNVDTYLEALKKVPVVSERKFKEVMEFLSEMAVMLAEQGLVELQSREAAQTIFESEERFKRLFNNLGEAVFVAEIGFINRGQILEINPAAEKQTGYSRNELIGMNIAKDLAIPKSGEISLDEWDTNLLNGEPITTTEKKRRKDGTQYWVEVIVTPIEYKGIKACLSINRDITKQKKAEDELKESEKRYRTLTEAAQDSVFIIDRQDNITFVNSYGASLFGQLPKDIIGKPRKMMFPPEVFESQKIDLQQVFKSGKPIIKDAKISYGKHEVWQSTRLVPLKSDTGEIYAVLGISRDITDLKYTESALKESERFHRVLLDDMVTFVTVLKPNGEVIFVNNTTLKVGGLRLEDVVGKKYYNCAWWTHSEEVRQTVKKFVEQCGCGETLIHDIQIRKADGSLMWIEFSMHPIFDEDGSVKYLIPEGRNISVRKKAEEDISKLSIAVAQSPSVIAITDLKGNLEYVNPKFTDLTGYTFEEAIGQNPKILKSDYQSDVVYKELWKTITSGKEWRGEFHNKKKDGELFWEAASVSPIIDKQGKTISYIKVAEDITERKRAEQIQKVLYNISNAAITTDNLKKLIDLIRKELGTIIDTTNFYVALYNEKTNEFSLPFHIDKFDKIVTFSAEKTLTAYVVKNKKSLLATKEVKNNLVQSGEVELIGTDSEVWLGVPLKIEGKVTGVFAVQNYTDKNTFNESDLKMLEFVSDQISISIDRKKAVEDLIIALKKAEESDRLKTAFLQNVSHEIRTPMNGIQGFIELLKEPNLSGDEQQEFLRIIQQSGNRMLKTIKDLMDISLIESGQVKISVSEINLNKQNENFYNIYKTYKS